MSHFATETLFLFGDSSIGQTRMLEIYGWRGPVYSVVWSS